MGGAGERKGKGEVMQLYFNFKCIKIYTYIFITITDCIPRDKRDGYV